MPLNLKHQTAAEFIARFREAYRDANKERLAKMARFLINSEVAGDITTAQIRTAFGLTVAQWATLKGKMNSLIAAQNAVDAAKGE